MSGRDASTCSKGLDIASKLSTCGAYPLTVSSWHVHPIRKPRVQLYRGPRPSFQTVLSGAPPLRDPIVSWAIAPSWGTGAQAWLEGGRWESTSDNGGSSGVDQSL